MIPLQVWWQQFLNNGPFIQLLDIIIVWFLIDRLLVYARGTQMMNLLKGVGIFVFVKFISSLIGLHTIDWLLGQILSWGVVAAIVLFQPELRRALEILGRNLFRNRQAGKDKDAQFVDDLEEALIYMSRRKIGALISIEGQDELAEYIATGIAMHSDISNELLINIFIPNTPLHDGAVIIQPYRIAAASCYLPLSESDQIPKELGTRHRAAIGLSEVTDAVTLIVSEETGDISIAHGDQLDRGIAHKDLRQRLSQLFESDFVAQDPGGYWDLLNQVRDFFLDAFDQKGDSDEG